MHVYGSTHLGEHERFKDTIYLTSLGFPGSLVSFVPHLPPLELGAPPPTGHPLSQVVSC